MREPAKALELPLDPDSVATIRVWHCKYRTLAPLAAFRNLKGAEIVTFPDDSLEVLGQLRELRYLHILHLPKVHDLSPLAELEALQVLRLATLPSWDASNRRTEVLSLEPLAALKNLEALELFSVIPVRWIASGSQPVASTSVRSASRFSRRRSPRFPPGGSQRRSRAEAVVLTPKCRSPVPSTAGRRLGRRRVPSTKFLRAGLGTARAGIRSGFGSPARRAATAARRRKPVGFTRGQAAT